jgi:hypothetical protein
MTLENGTGCIPLLECTILWPYTHTDYYATKGCMPNGGFYGNLELRQVFFLPVPRGFDPIRSNPPQAEGEKRSAQPQLRSFVEQVRVRFGRALVPPCCTQSAIQV